MRRLAASFALAIEQGCRAAAVGLGIAIFLLMLAGIAGRHVLSQGLPVVTELPEQLFPWWVAVSIVLAARHGAHVAVLALALALPPSSQRALQACVRLATLIMSVGIVWVVVQIAAVSGGDRSPILGVPLVHMHTALGLAFGALALLAVCEMLGERR